MKKVLRSLSTSYEEGWIRMDQIVAVAVELADRSKRFYLTWGRIQHAVDPEPLEQLVLKHCSGDDLGGEPINARVCLTLQEAVHAPYFYEGFFSFCQDPLPSEDEYEAWRARMNQRMQQGEELYYLGNPDRLPKRRP